MIYRTTDKALIASIMGSVEGFDHCRGNFWNPQAIYLYDGEGCLFPCVPSTDFISCHVAILPGSRGKKAVSAGRDAIRWLKSNTKYRIFARTDVKLKHAMVFNRLIGLERFAQNEKYAFYRG